MAEQLHHSLEAEDVTVLTQAEGERDSGETGGEDSGRQGGSQGQRTTKRDEDELLVDLPISSFQEEPFSAPSSRAHHQAHGFKNHTSRKPSTSVAAIQHDEQMDMEVFVARTETVLKDVLLADVPFSPIDSDNDNNEIIVSIAPDDLPSELAEGIEQPVQQAVKKSVFTPIPTTNWVAPKAPFKLHFHKAEKPVVFKADFAEKTPKMEMPAPVRTSQPAADAADRAVVQKPIVIAPDNTAEVKTAPEAATRSEPAVKGIKLETLKTRVEDTAEKQPDLFVSAPEAITLPEPAVAGIKLETKPAPQEQAIKPESPPVAAIQDLNTPAETVTVTVNNNLNNQIEEPRIVSVTPVTNDQIETPAAADNRPTEEAVATVAASAQPVMEKPAEQADAAPQDNVVAPALKNSADEIDVLSIIAAAPPVQKTPASVNTVSAEVIAEKKQDLRDETKIIVTAAPKANEAPTVNPDPAVAETSAPEQMAEQAKLIGSDSNRSSATQIPSFSSPATTYQAQPSFTASNDTGIGTFKTSRSGDLGLPLNEHHVVTVSLQEAFWENETTLFYPEEAHQPVLQPSKMDYWDTVTTSATKPAVVKL